MTLLEQIRQEAVNESAKLGSLLWKCKVFAVEGSLSG
jgi:hypothetical protein